MEYLYPLIATDRDGNTKLFYDADSFRKFVNTRNIGDSFVTYDLYNVQQLIVNDYIVRDDLGRKINLEDFYVHYVYHRKFLKYTHRDGPVPKIGHNIVGYKQNAPAKKNGGNGQRSKQASKARYENKIYGLNDIRSEQYTNPWWM